MSHCAHYIQPGNERGWKYSNVVLFFFSWRISRAWIRCKMVMIMEDSQSKIMSDFRRQKLFDRRAFWICGRGKLWLINHLTIKRLKATFSKCFKSTWKRKVGVFRFFLFEERFRKTLLSWRFNLYGKPNRRNKAAFLNSSGVAWTRPQRDVSWERKITWGAETTCV